MANIRLIKRRIKSAQNISQITKAMEMVAASKMKRSQEVALMGKPYAEKIKEIVSRLAGKSTESHPLLLPGSQEGKMLVILISTNKGLCGGLNTSLFRKLNQWIDQRDAANFITVGKKGQSFIVRSKKSLIADFSEDVPFVKNVPPLTRIIVSGFIEGKYSDVYLAYNTFVSALKQEPTVKLLLPLKSIKVESESAQSLDLREMLIEPELTDVLEYILPHYLENQIRTAIFEAEASEHSARMIAMKNATDAANDFVSGLTLVYNKARQDSITSEIADLITARMAVA